AIQTAAELEILQDTLAGIEAQSRATADELQLLESALQGLLAGVGAEVGGPVGGAIGGLGAGISRTAEGALEFSGSAALIGAGVGILTSALGDLFGAGGAAEEAAAQAERARKAWEQALDALAELAAPS